MEAVSFAGAPVELTVAGGKQGGIVLGIVVDG